MTVPFQFRDSELSGGSTPRPWGQIPSGIRALVFDMDGTIVDSMPAHARSWETFCLRQGIALPVAEILRRTTGRNGVECIREVFEREVPEEEALRLIAEKEAIYRDGFTEAFREVDGFTAFYGRARAAGLPCALATAGDRHNIRFVLDRLRLDPPPDAIVGGDEGLPGKPDPALFLEAARRMGRSPAECLVFEDAPFGIEAARRAGMAAIGVCTTHSADELSGAHVVGHIRSYAELMD